MSLAQIIKYGINAMTVCAQGIARGLQLLLSSNGI